MRRALLALLPALLAGCLAGQRPELALAGVTASGEVVPLDSLTSTYRVGDLTVIHRVAPTSEVVAANLYLLGGSRQLTARTAGIEALMLAASEYGTRRYPGERTRLAQGLSGSRFTIESAADWSMLGFQGLASDLDSTWAVFADRITDPALDSAALEVVRRKLLTSVRAAQNAPDGAVQRLADSIAFGGHAYAVPPSGTERSLLAITRDDVVRYHTEQMVTSRMLLVVVGNVSRARLESLVASTLAQLPRGAYAWSPPDAWTAGEAAVAVRARSLPTNYICGWFAGPPPTHRDYAAFRLATALLSAQVHARMRELGIAYAAHAPFLERGAPGGGIYVSTTAPAEAMRVINDVIDRLRTSTMGRHSLTFFAEQFILDYFQEHATSAAQAEFLARAHLYRGDWRLGSDYMAELRRVSPIAIRNAANRYIRGIRYAYVGDPDRVPAQELTRW